jgi:hypothetical protein
VKGKLRIDEIFAFIVTDTDGTEGVAAFLAPKSGGWMPMVAADRARVDSLMPMARDLARHGGVTIRLTRFSTREILEEIKP